MPTSWRVLGADERTDLRIFPINDAAQVAHIRSLHVPGLDSLTIRNTVILSEVAAPRSGAAASSKAPYRSNDVFRRSPKTRCGADTPVRCL